MAVAIFVSAFVALTLTPMLCSRLLSLGTSAAREGFVGAAARGFDRAIEGIAIRYERLLRTALSHRVWTVLLVFAAVGCSVLLFLGA